MEILFKSDDRIFFIEDDKLDNEWIPTVDLSNVTHLDDAEVLYHYKDKRGNMYPVYYEHSDRFITIFFSNSNYGWSRINHSFIKDYTLVNFKFLDNI